MSSSSGSASNGAGGTPPKRFKADNDPSLAAAGILKDGSTDESEPELHQERRKSRKSVGRRVSFAPTAHVRMFEVPEEKQQAAGRSNTYAMPDISSQTGMFGFNLGIMPSVEETSMTSNESFDVSVRHSDPSESLQSNESSFLADAGRGQTYNNILDNDDDDDLDEADGDDDAVTMELTGTVDMGAIHGGDDDDNSGNDSDYEASGAGRGVGLGMSDITGGFTAAPSEGALLAENTDAASFFNMLMQNSAADQQTSLLDNIISQFGQAQHPATTDNTTHSAADPDFTRVAMPVDDAAEEQDTAVHGGSAGGDSSEDDDEVGHDNDDAVTMDLTGVVPRHLDDLTSDADRDANDVFAATTTQSQHATPAVPRAAAPSGLGPASLGVAWGQASSGALMEMLGSLISTSQPSVSGGLAAVGSLPATPSIAAAAPTAPWANAAYTASNTPSRKLATPAGFRLLSPASMATPVRTLQWPVSTPIAASTPAVARTPAAARTPTVRTPAARTPVASRAPTVRTPVASRTPAAARTPATAAEPPSSPVFVLDPLPPKPRPTAPPVGIAASGPMSRAELAKAGLAMGIFEAYRHRQLVPDVAPAILELSEVPLKFEPLFRKAELKARLEYCSALSGLFEADQAVSQAAGADTPSFEGAASFFGAQNELLASRREELLLRISKAKQRLAQQAPSKEAGRLSGEMQELKAKLLDARQERDSTGAAIEQLGAEIQAQQTTSTSFDRQLSERKSAQQVLLAVNGLQPVDVAADSCDFIYDGFSRLHFDDAVGFTSLHPDVDWAAAIRSTVSAPDLTMRQYTVAAMKANAVLKGLLEDVGRVRRRTFVELGYCDGIQVRMQFFSRAHRRRFHLQIPLATVESYSQLHLETEFDWAAEVLYGDIDAARLRECLRACRISPSQPLLSIFEHIDSAMAAL